MENENEIKIITTSDISFAAFCIAHGVRFIKVREQYHNRFIFEFINTPQFPKLEQEYINNGSVPIREFTSAREMLISQIKNWKVTVFHKKT